MYTEQRTGGDKNGKDDPYGAALDCAIAAVKEIGE